MKTSYAFCVEPIAFNPASIKPSSNPIHELIIKILATGADVESTI